MEVADPAGPITARTIQSIELAECTSLAGYPHVATPRVHTVGMCPDGHPVGFASRGRRRRDLNPGHGRDRTVCSPDYTTSACSRPGRNRTGDLRIQSPASLASGDSGARRSRSYRYGGAYQRFPVRSARSEPPVRSTVRNERRPDCREPHPVYLLDAVKRMSYWMKTGDNPVFPSPGRVVRVGAGLCG